MPATVSSETAYTWKDAPTAELDLTEASKVLRRRNAAHTRFGNCEVASQPPTGGGFKLIGSVRRAIWSFDFLLTLHETPAGRCTLRGECLESIHSHAFA